ncbi:hypothetical protein [Methylobacterium sp. A52T]
MLAKTGPVPAAGQRVRFDPYRAPDFLLTDGGPISAAALVWFLAAGSYWAVPIPSERPHA